MTLTEEGRIDMAGGCVAYMKGSLLLTPGDDGVRLVVDNEQGIFHGEQPVESYEIVLSPQQVHDFLVGLEAIVDNPEPSKGVSTWAAVIDVHLPLESGTIELTLREVDGEVDVYPLLRYIKAFVASHAPGK